MTSPLILAHRGASDACVENSIDAFHLATELGADGVEFDIHTSRDGTMFIHHDRILPGIGPIDELSSRTIATYRLPNGERLPTLEEGLAAVGPLDAWIELKSLPAHHDDTFLDVLRSTSGGGSLGVHSFDHRIIHRIALKAPQLQYGLLSASYPVAPFAVFQDSPATVLWQAEELIDSPLIEGATARGLRVVAWTVGSIERARVLTHLGVWGLCGNDPSLLRASSR